MEKIEHYRCTFRQKINERFALNLYLHCERGDEEVIHQIVDLILDNSDYNYATIVKVNL